VSRLQQLLLVAVALQMLLAALAAAAAAWGCQACTRQVFAVL
jgi:uncharacterized membrane protein